MGSRGPAPKPPARRQRKTPRKSPLSVVPQPAAGAVPDPSSKWLRATVIEWEAYWSSPVSNVAQPTDLPPLRRLFDYRDERRRLQHAIAKNGRLVEGSKGQVRKSPLLEMLKDTEAAINNLESAFGLTPLARARLGIAVGEARKTLEDLNNELLDRLETERDAIDAELDDDPRVAAYQRVLAAEDQANDDLVDDELTGSED